MTLLFSPMFGCHALGLFTSFFFCIGIISVCKLTASIRPHEHVPNAGDLVLTDMPFPKRSPSSSLHRVTTASIRPSVAISCASPSAVIKSIQAKLSSSKKLNFSTFSVA